MKWTQVVDPLHHIGLSAIVALIPILYIFWALIIRKMRGFVASVTATGLAVLIAVGIGLHNFGEGLAIGSAFALGEAALGTLLIVGFTLHNTTEGLAIVAPLARAGTRPSLGALMNLGLIGGVPTIVGAWIGDNIASLFADALGFLVRDLDAELVLQAHDQLDDVERVGAQVLLEARLRRHLACVGVKLVCDDVPNLLEDLLLVHRAFLLSPS